MSYDFAVWYPSKIFSNDEATKVYYSLCNGEKTDLVENEKVEQFYNDLVSKYPEINDVLDGKIEESPWSVEIDHAKTHVIMCCVFSQAEEVSRYIIELIKRHELALYDPQREQIFFPESKVKPWWRFW